MVIVKEKELPGVPPATPDDAPPSYHHLEPSSGSSIHSQTRRPPPLHPHRSTPSLNSSPSSSPSPHRSSSSTTPSPSFATLIETKLESGKSKLKSSLIEFLSGGTAQNVKDVKNMAYMSIRDAVKNPGAQQILQDPCLEGHRALYWIIISRPPQDEYGVLSTILKHCGPLSSEAVDEVRLACVQVGDQTLFNHLWRHPVYGALSGTDELLLGVRAPTDYVDVREAMADEIGQFIARFVITQFHKRMNISGEIAFEFIARGSYVS
jgi:hypothetical protein